MDKIFEISLPALPDSSNYEQAGKAQQGIALAALASMARTNWVSLASKRFSNNGRKYLAYVNAIQQPEILPGVATISLVGKEAHDIEFGRASYDLRDVLLGKNVPVKKRGESGRGKYRSAKTGGFYRPIPFRHSGPDSAGVVGAPMGSQYAQLKVGAMSAPDAKNLGRFVYNAAKQLKASTESPNRKTQWGERLIAGLAPKLKDHHVTDIFAGATRIQKTYLNAKTGRSTTQAQIKTFRTISTNVRRGWIMPATTGVFIMAALKGHMQTHAPQVITQIQNPP